MSRIGKQQLAKTVAARVGLSVRATQQVVGEIFAVIAAELAKGNSVAMTGFGSWRTRVHKPRTGRSPKDGRALAIPARSRVCFKPGASLRQVVETSIDAEIFFGDGVARQTEIGSILNNLFDAEAQDLDLEKVRQSIRKLLDPATDREAQEFFRDLCPDELVSLQDAEQALTPQPDGPSVADAVLSTPLPERPTPNV